MKKLLLTIAATFAFIGLNAQIYTDVTPAKFDFSAYTPGAVTDFWDADMNYAEPHTVSGSTTDAQGLIKMAEAAAFGSNGYAYFYANNALSVNSKTTVVNIDGKYNVLEFGDLASGFGGCYFVPFCEQRSGYMRTTMICRLVDGSNTSNEASIVVGVRNNASVGDATDQTITYATLKAGEWVKIVAEYNSVYSLRINLNQSLWGDKLQIAQLKFEEMTSVPAEYVAVKQTTTGTAEDFGLYVAAPIGYTDVTPAKFDFAGYSNGDLPDFWDAIQYFSQPHKVAGDTSDARSVTSMAQAAAFGDSGYSYFYMNPEYATTADPNTKIVKVPGVGKVLQFGDVQKGWGGCYFVPFCEQKSGYIRATMIYRIVDGSNASNTSATVSIGARDVNSGGYDLPAVSYNDLIATTDGGKWNKVVLEYNPTYSLRINFAGIVQGDNIQIAQLKFEEMSSVPAEYTRVEEATTGTAVELGINHDTGSDCIDIIPDLNHVGVNDIVVLNIDYLNDSYRGRDIEWSIVEAECQDYATLTPGASGTCTVKVNAHTGTFTVKALIDGEVALATFKASSDIVNSDGIISVESDHTVMQEISYCGRGNPNEPLTKVVFYNEHLKDWLDTEAHRNALVDELQQYSISLAPYFNSVGGNAEMLNLRAYVRIYPQTHIDIEQGNPLRGDMVNGKRTGPVEPVDAIDLGVFDYRAPLLTSHQTTFDLGFLQGASDALVSGDEYTVTMSAEVAKQMVKVYQAVLANLNDPADDAHTYLNYFDPRFFIYICADLSESASDMDGTERNRIGGVVTRVVTPAGEYTGAGILSAFRQFKTEDATGIRTPWKANTHHMTSRRQTEHSRTILHRRVLTYAPFDGYSRYYRIPGLTDLQDGTLVMTTDARKFHNHDVSNNFDIVSRVSKDNGLTWSQPNIVAEGSWPAEDDCTNAIGFGDAALGDLPTPGNIISVFISGKGFGGVNLVDEQPAGPNLSYAISTTSGRSWGEVRQIPTNLFAYDPDIDPGQIDGYAIASPGPGRMCPITTGKHKGKMLFASYMHRTKKGTTQTLKNNGPLNFLAYDEDNNEWVNLGHLGDLTDVYFGESQLVEIPQFTAEGAEAEPIFLLSSRNERYGTDRTQPTRIWLLLIPDASAAAANYLPTFDKTDSDLDDIIAGRTDIVRLTEGNNPFGSGAGECNSNFIIYHNTDGDSNEAYYLAQAFPVAKSQELGYGSNTNRSRLTLKVADITTLVKEGPAAFGHVINWKDNDIDFSDPLGTLSDAPDAVDSNRDTGYMNTGYSCISTQKDGRIGIATEEYPYSYRPAPEHLNNDAVSCTKTDVLLGGWYNSVTLASLGIEEFVTGREIPKPTTYPETATFKLETGGVAQLAPILHEGTFVENSSYSLPNVKFTVNPDDVKVLAGEKWRIDYDFFYRLHGSTTGEKIFSFHGPWYDPEHLTQSVYALEGGHRVQDSEGHDVVSCTSYGNSDGTWTVEMSLPMNHADFQSTVVPFLEDAAGVSYADWDALTDDVKADYIERARSDGYIHADDSFVVRCRVGVYPATDAEGNDYDDTTIPEIYNTNNWTRDRIDQGLINATGYYAVSPSRKMIVHIRPQGVDASVEMSTEYATATFSNLSNLPEDESSNIWLFGRPSYDQFKVRLHALIPDNSPARFLGYTLNPALTLDEDNFDTSNEDLLRNKQGAWIDSYDAASQPVYGVATQETNEYGVAKGTTLSSPNLRFMNVHPYPDPEQIHFYVPSKATYPGDAGDYDRLDIYAWFASDGGLFSTCELRYDYYDEMPVDLVSMAGFATDESYTNDNAGNPRSYADFKNCKPNPEFDKITYPLVPYNRPNIYSGSRLEIPFHWKHKYDNGYFEMNLVPDKYGYGKCAAVTVWSCDDEGRYTNAPSTLQYTLNNDGTVNSTAETRAVTTIYGKGYESKPGVECWSSSSSLPREITIPVSFSGSFGDDQRIDKLLGIVLVSITDIPVDDTNTEAFINAEANFLNNGLAAAASPAPRKAIMRAAGDSFITPQTFYRVAYPVYDSKVAVTSVEDVATDAIDADPVYYDLTGCIVTHPQKGRLYIRVTGNKATKIVY